MIEIIKRDWMYLALTIVLIILSAMVAGLFRYGFFTAYDEAYFLLKMQEAYDMSCITGKSQWNLIAAHWFPYLELTSKIYSSWASAILHWVSIVVMTATACMVFDKKRVLKYFSLIFLAYFFSGGVLNYVPMQMAVLCWGFCAFILFHHTQKQWCKCLFALICGLFLGFSCFIILPAALVLLAIIAILIIILYFGEIKKICMYEVSGLVGVLLAVLYMHIVVCDIREIVDAMMFTASYIGKSGYNYDGVSFIIQYGLFFCDFLFVVLAFVGAYWFSTLVKNRIVAAIIYLGLLLVYTHYQVKPIHTPFMFFSSIVLIPFLFSNRCKLTIETFRNKNTYLYLFLFFFPMIASLGTNTNIGSRLGLFLISWLFIYFEQELKHPDENWKRVLLTACILLLIPLCKIPKDYINRDDSYHFTRGSKHVAELALLECQKDYFDRVYDILELYDFQPHQSAVLTAVYDYCCLYAFDAVNAANYHQVKNFHYFPKEKMIEPDFIFLCKWDSIVMADELRELPWGWPEEFDEYYVGTPEPENAPWINNIDMETRKLYCRKSKKINL